MELHFNTTKENRKAMADAISKELGKKTKYPENLDYAYQVGDYFIKKDGTLVFEKYDVEENARVIDACVMATGNSPSEWEQNTESV